MISTSDLTRVIGSKVVDSLGKTIGTAREVYLDDATGRPEWVTVSTGFLGTAEAFVPLAGAELTDDTLLLPFEGSTVKGAPRPDAAGHLTPADEAELYRHYGIAPDMFAVQDVPAAGPPTASTTTSTTSATAGTATTGTAGALASPGDGAGADDAMTRSEERLRVGTEQHVTGRARLRKFVTTEVVTVEVPVRREEVRLVHEPAGEPGVTAGPADQGEAYDGPPVQLPDGETVLVLHEERPVVTTETVPVERVRMSTETVTETRAVSGQVRTEHIEVDGDVVDDEDGTTRRG